MVVPSHLDDAERHSKLRIQTLDYKQSERLCLVGSIEVTGLLRWFRALLPRAWAWIRWLMHLCITGADQGFMLHLLPLSLHWSMTNLFDRQTGYFDL